MDIEFDPTKDRINRRKHGLSLAWARDFDFDVAFFEIDDSQDYGEVRSLALSFLDARLYPLTFTMNDNGDIRAISLRKATRDEESRYDQGSQIRIRCG